MLFANVCAGLIRSCCGEFWEWHVLGFLASLLCRVCLGSASFAGPPCANKTWVTLVCLLLDTSFWRRSAGAITFVTTGGNVRQLIKVLIFVVL